MKEIVCIVCPQGCLLKVNRQNGTWVVKGNLCLKGEKFAIEEMVSAKRAIASTVKTIFDDVPRLPVRTDGEIPKEYIFPLMELINKVVVDKIINSGDIILENVFDTGINVISTSDIHYLLEGRFVRGTKNVKEV